MIVIDSNTPVDIFEFGVICYCPDTHKTISENGLVISRMSEFQYIIGILNVRPNDTKKTTEELFDKHNPGLIWTCPKALKEPLLNQTLLLRDVINYWLRVDESVGLINIAFEVASKTLLNEYFPREELVIKSLNTLFMEESQLLKQVPLRQSAFFKDQYNGQWIISRTNVSLLCLVKVFYDVKSSTLKVLSEAFMLNELALIVMKDQFSEREWEDLTLSELLTLKNLMHQYCSAQALHEPFTQSFRVYPISDVQTWISPLKLNMIK